MITIYLITNSVNDKKYVGQTVQKLKDRWGAHCCKSVIKRGRPIALAIAKYGKEVFEIKEIDRADSIEEANKKEVYWTNFYNCFAPNGYSLKAGGRFYSHLSEETKKKISLRHKGKKLSIEQIENMRAARLGRKHTPEHKRKISESSKGRIPTSEALQKRSTKLCKRYFLRSPNNEIIEVINLKRFCKENGFCYSSFIHNIVSKKNIWKGWLLVKNCGLMSKYIGSQRHPAPSSQEFSSWEDYPEEPLKDKPIRKTGFTPSEESRKKMSLARKGIPRPEYWKRVIQLNLDGEIINDFPSLTEAAKITKIRLSAIHNCLSGKSKTSGGYKWSYHKD